MKLDRKQDLNVRYQVCVFRADRKNKIAAMASDWLRHFRLLLWNCWTEFNETWQEARSLLYLVCDFRTDRKYKMAAIASDWLRHFRLFLLNWWMEFNKIWHEARSQRPLPSLCLSGQSEEQDGRPGFWLAETFSTSPLKPLNRIPWNLTGRMKTTSSTKFVFFCADKYIKMAALAKGARYIALWASCFNVHFRYSSSLLQYWVICFIDARTFLINGHACLHVFSELDECGYSKVCPLKHLIFDT